LQIETSRSPHFPPLTTSAFLPFGMALTIDASIDAVPEPANNSTSLFDVSKIRASRSRHSL
jgi:hypothetical protein